MSRPNLKSVSNKWYELKIIDMEERFKIFNDQELELIANLDSEWLIKESGDVYPALLEKLKKTGFNPEEISEGAFELKIVSTDDLRKLRDNFNAICDLPELNEVAYGLDSNQNDCLDVDFFESKDNFSSTFYQQVDALSRFDEINEKFNKDRCAILEKLKESLSNPNNKRDYKIIKKCIVLLSDV